ITARAASERRMANPPREKTPTTGSPAVSKVSVGRVEQPLIHDPDIVRIGTIPVGKRLDDVIAGLALQYTPGRLDDEWLVDLGGQDAVAVGAGVEGVPGLRIVLDAPRITGDIRPK